MPPRRPRGSSSGQEKRYFLLPRSLLTSQWPNMLEPIPGFRSMKRLGVFLLSPGWDASSSGGALDSRSSGPGSGPSRGTLCCVLGQDTLLSRCLSPPRCINGYQSI